MAGLFVLALITAVRAWAEGTAPPDTAATPQSERVGPIKLHDVPIDQILELLERWTGKSILRPQTLPTAAVSLNLKDEVTKPQAIRAIETLLSLNGVGVTTLDENFLKITPLNAIKAEAPELIVGSTLALPPSGLTAAKLFRPAFLRLNEFTPQIAGLLNPAVGSAPVLFEKANAVLITDSITNLQRVETLLAEIDRPQKSSVQPKFYALNYAKASDVVTKLHGMLSGSLQTDTGSASYSADDRTNQIVLFADPQQFGAFDQLIAKLDVKSGQDTRNEIIYLNHAAAKDVASILSQLVSGQNGAARGLGQEPPRGTVSAPKDQPSPPASPTGAAGGPAVTGQIKLEPAIQFSSLLTILPEERSNAIVVSGTNDDIHLIHDLVAKIDVLLAQVRIEVVIAEVSLDDSATTGISALGLQVSGDKLVGFSGSFPGLNVANGTITRADPNASPPASVSGPWDLAAQISLTATPRKTNTNILSVPNIITSHNREGKIFVGEEWPVISSYLNNTTAGAGGSVVGGYQTTVSSKDIGIELSVKPLIGADGSVQLDIKQEVNDIVGNITIDGNQQPIIGRRSTESFVSARSGEIIVLGGLQRSTRSRTTSRLGPLPIIGDLLGSRTRDKTRSDLVFFLRPTVLTNTFQDGASAMAEVDHFPKEQRKEIKKIIQPPPIPRSK